MRCPSCGHENSNVVTRCSVCGSPLPSVALVHEEDTERRYPNLFSYDEDFDEEDYDNYDEDFGQDDSVMLEVEVSPPSPNADDNWHEQAPREHKVVRFFATHDRALGIGLAIIVVAVLGAAWFFVVFGNKPATEQITNDLGTRMPSYAYAGGTYGADLEIPLTVVSVTRSEATRTPEGLEVDGGIGGTAYAVEADVTYEDGALRIVRSVGATYVRAGDGWELAGELSDQGTSFFPKTGIDEAKLMENVASVLSAASGSGYASLADIYANGTFSVMSNHFEEAPDKDTAIDEVVIHCAKESGFYTYEGNVTAHFAFESGEWRLRSAEHDEQATKRTYDQLVGTWTGSLVNHDAADKSCYGARDYPLTVTINSVGDSANGQGQVQGTFSGIAHYHGRLRADVATNEGDTYLENVPITGVIDPERNEETGSNLNVECVATGEVEGTITVELGFGTDEDPSAVIARVTTEYGYEDVAFFFIPHQTTAHFTDTYVLSRAA